MDRPEVRTLLQWRSAGSPRVPIVDHRGQAEGAMDNGTRVAKVKSAYGDAHQDGAAATILGSLRDPESGRIAYFVEWDDLPGLPVAIVDSRLEPFG